MKKTKKNTQNLIHIYRFWNFLSLFCHYWCIQMWMHACTVVNDGARAFHIFLSIVVNVVSIIWGVNYKFCNQNVNLTWSQIDANAKNILSHTNKHTHAITLTLNLWTINLIEEGRIIFDFFLYIYRNIAERVRFLDHCFFARFHCDYEFHESNIAPRCLAHCWNLCYFSLTMKHDSVYWAADWTQFSHPYIRIHIDFLSFYLVCLLCPVFGFESSN